MNLEKLLEGRPSICAVTVVGCLWFLKISTSWKVVAYKALLIKHNEYTSAYKSIAVEKKSKHDEISCSYITNSKTIKGGLVCTLQQSLQHWSLFQNFCTTIRVIIEHKLFLFIVKDHKMKNVLSFWVRNYSCLKDNCCFQSCWNTSRSYKLLISCIWIGSLSESWVWWLIY